MPGPLPYLKKKERGGYEAWETMQEVYDTTGNLKGVAAKLLIDQRE
jgi:hypothetical protein